MNIESLKKSHPDVLFIELNSAPQVNNFFEIKTIDEFLNLTSKVGYKIIKIKSDDTFKFAINMCLDEFYQNSFEYFNQQMFSEYVYDYIEKHSNCILKKLFPAHEHIQVILYALDANYLFFLNNSLPYSSENYDEGIRQIQKIYIEFEYNLKVIQENQQQELKDFILKYKKEYTEAKSNLAKEQLLKQIQYDIRECFSINGRSNPMASKIGITKLLSNEQTFHKF